MPIEILLHATGSITVVFSNGSMLVISIEEVGKNLPTLNQSSLSSS